MDLTVVANNKNMKFKCTEYKNGKTNRIIFLL